MADFLPSRISPSKVVCRYFLMSRCLKGDKCEFVHQAMSNSNLNDLASDAGKGQYSVCELSQGHDVCQGRIQNEDEDGLQSCCNDSSCDSVQGRGQGQGHSSNELPAFDDVFRTTLTSDQDAVTRVPDNGSSTAASLRPEDWVKAPEFVPGQMWQFRGSVKSPVVEPAVSSADESATLPPVGEPYTELSEACPGSSMEGNAYVGQGVAYPDPVSMASAEVCELCGSVVLTTLTGDQRQKHIGECIEQHEREMERSFAIQRSQEKMCGICTDVVWEKPGVSEQRFGILSNCNHVFCLQCIRKWRSTKHFENKIVRACPECRVKSDFVTPSQYWVEDKEDKKKLIEEYKLALSKKPCKYFDKGRGECPFNEKCFYLHAHPDGRVASPKPAYRRRRAPATSSSQTSESGATPSTPHAVLYEILTGWPLDRWEDLFFHLNLFELSLPSTSDEEDDDDDDFDDDDYLSGIL